LKKLPLERIFNSYFHSKYNFNNFLNYELILSSNINEINYSKYNFIAYIKKNTKLIQESKKLQDYHRFINSILIKYMDISNSVYSYRNDKKLVDAVRIHKNNKYFFKTDISDFFNSIDSDIISDTLNDNMNNYPISDISVHKDKILNLLNYNNTLPVGFVTSSALSNAILYKFDIKIEEFCNKHNILYSRYSDDLIFSHNKDKNLFDIRSEITKILDEIYDNKLKLNEKKSLFLDKTKNINILGIIITPQNHVTVKKNIKENIKNLLYFYTNDKEKFNNFLNTKYKGSIIRAYGTLNYINDIDKNFILYLRKKYGNFIIDKFLHGNKNYEQF
jgi:RNA-directed DNA polymerase